MGIKSVYIHKIISSSFLAILITLSMYVLEGDQNKHQIMIFNQTDMLSILMNLRGQYFHLGNSDSLTLNNYESISVQDSIPLGLPQAKKMDMVDKTIIFLFVEME
jgi:predicted transporter